MKLDLESGPTANRFQLTTTEAMSSYEDRFVKIRVVFQALNFENEVGDPSVFCISDIGNSLSDCSKSIYKKKKTVL